MAWPQCISHLYCDKTSFFLKNMNRSDSTSQKAKPKLRVKFLGGPV